MSLDDKLDRLLEAVARLEPTVTDTKTAVHETQRSIRNIEIKNAQQDERIKNMEGDLDGLGQKLRGHASDRSLHDSAAVRPPNAIIEHWKLFVAACGLVVTIIGLVMKFS